MKALLLVFDRPMWRNIRLRSSLIPVGIALAAQLAGCSDSAAPPAEEAAVAESAAPPGNRMSACEMLNASEMTVLLGGEVSAQPSGAAKCVYSPVAGSAPQAELEIERGKAEAAFRALAKNGRIAAGEPNPLAGLADQAAQVGPMLLVRAGADLVKITVSGAKNGPGALRAIFMLVRPRL